MAAVDEEVTSAGASVAIFFVTVVGAVCDVDSAPGNHTNTKWLHCICYYQTYIPKCATTSSQVSGLEES